jgi:hypothetical protein
LVLADISLAVAVVVIKSLVAQVALVVQAAVVRVLQIILLAREYQIQAQVVVAQVTVHQVTVVQGLLLLDTRLHKGIKNGRYNY